MDIEELKQKAHTGDPDACFDLGLSYQKGCGVKRDITEAIFYYKKAIKAGDVLSAFNLGIIFLNADNQETMKWFKIVAEKGHAKSQNILGDYCYEKGKKLEAKKWYTLAAENGHIFSQHNLAILLQNNDAKILEIKTEQIRLREMIYWYEKAAEQNYPHAIYNLGCCYLNGEEVNKDNAKANEYFERAAELGEPFSKVQLLREVQTKLNKRKKSVSDPWILWDIKTISKNIPRISI